jgi:hypothetical protein
MKKIILLINILNYSICASQLDKTYNEHAILMTHNATSLKKTSNFAKRNVSPKVNAALEALSSYKSGNLVANQNLPVEQQLKDGVRGFKIPLHIFSNGEIYVCHTLSRDQLRSHIDSISGKLPDAFKRLPVITQKIDELKTFNDNPCLLDTTHQSFLSFLKQINAFLEANHDEVVTLYLDAFALDKTDPEIQSKIRTLFVDSGIVDKIYFDAGHNIGKPWPTLRDMIGNKKQIVIFSGHPHWENLSVFDFDKIGLRTNYDYKNIQALDDDTNNPQIEGDPKPNKIFMIDNYTTPLVAGSESDAEIVNHYAKLKNRFLKYQKATGFRPNILHIDFYQLPDDPNNNPIRFIRDWNQDLVREL